MSVSAAFKSLQLTLARWKAPSAWDVVMQDEPLEIPEGHWENLIPTGATGNVTLTVPTGVTVSNGTLISVVANGTFTRMRVLQEVLTGAADELQTVEDQRVFAALTGSYVHEPRIADQSVPYPRNRKERRILKTADLATMIRKAEMVHGPRAKARDLEKWNKKFWELVTRPDHPDVILKMTKKL